MEDIIVRIVSRIVFPFIQLYGLYIILHGHLSPGGGFPGGAIIGASMILFALSFSLSEGSKKISHDILSITESGGVLCFALLGLVAIFLGSNFLGNKAAGFGLGIPGNLFSSGIILPITLFIGIKVASTVITLFYNLIGEETEDGNSK